jgi:adenosylmethionine-8-amino-7-oxononanoate aminotransferase
VSLAVPSSPEALQRTAHEHLLLHFTRNGAYAPGGAELLVLERGEGPYVFDTRGRRYLDGLSSLFCSQIGYSYGEEMAAAASAQMSRLAFNTLWSTAHPPAIELASRLAALAPEGIEQVFFTCGGSESVEAAWKLARQHHVFNGQPQRTKAIARATAYHGVTLGALSFTGVPGFKDAFGAPAVPTTHVSNTNAFRRPEQGEQLTRALLDELEATIEAEGPELCDRHGILLVADEVICAFGRLGEWLGSTYVGGAPDMITTAKGITSAYMPMGAVLVGERVAATLEQPGRALLHGITFGGHPVAAAVALENLEIFERDRVLENVRALEPHLRARMEGLRELPIVGDVRGAGFFWAVELVPDGAEGRFDAEQREELLRRFLPGCLLEHGLIARGDDRGDTVVQIAPPLICDRATLDELVDRLAAVLAAVSRHMHIPVAA